MGLLDFSRIFAVLESSSTARVIISASVGIGGEMGEGSQ
jgi:hypothetical protein